MRNAFERVLDRMSEVIHRINAPLCALAVMVDETDAVNDRIAHVEVAAGKIDLGAQGHLSFFHFAVFHHFKQAQIFFDGSVPVGADRRYAEIAAVCLELLGGEFAL